MQSEFSDQTWSFIWHGKHISTISHCLLPILHLNPTMERCCPEPPLIAFRRPRNLHNCIIGAKSIHHGHTRTCPHNVRTMHQKGTKKGRKCELCHVLPEQSSITSSSTSKIHRLRLQTPADCDSQFVVYAITCTLCPSVNQYVGQTSKNGWTITNRPSDLEKMTIVTALSYTLTLKARITPLTPYSSPSWKMPRQTFLRNRRNTVDVEAKIHHATWT
jgi:hypothetical protein